MLNLRQLRLNGEVIKMRNISNLFGGKMMCVCVFFFLGGGEKEDDELRVLQIRNGLYGGDKEMTSQKEREREVRGLIVEFKAIEIEW